MTERVGDRITWHRVDLLVAGMVHSSFPAGSFVCPSDEAVFLYPVLEEALAACGLAERASDVHSAMRELVQSHFAKSLEAFELERQRVIGTLDEEHA